MDICILVHKNGEIRSARLSAGLEKTVSWLSSERKEEFLVVVFQSGANKQH